MHMVLHVCLIAKQLAALKCLNEVISDTLQSEESKCPRHKELNKFACPGLFEIGYGITKAIGFTFIF